MRCEKKVSEKCRLAGIQTLTFKIQVQRSNWELVIKEAMSRYLLFFKKLKLVIASNEFQK